MLLAMDSRENRQCDVVPSIWCTEERLNDLETGNACVQECILQRSTKTTGVQSGHTNPAISPLEAPSQLSCLRVHRFTDIPDVEQDQYDSSLSRACHTSVDPSSIGITASQRATIVDSMIADASSLHLGNNALFLAVAYFDRYLAAIPTSLELLQPLSVACLWVAAKYDSAVTPRSAAFASLVKDPHGNQMSPKVAMDLLLLLEASLLQALDYRLASVDTAKSHVQEIMHKLQTSAKTPCPSIAQVQHQQLYCMMSYLAEVSLLECQLLPAAPAQLAAASYAFAQILLGRGLDMDLLTSLTGYTFPQLHGTLQYLCALHTTLITALNNGKPYAVSAKYAAPAVHAVARVSPLCDPRDPRLFL